ncbi:MAG: hypothetical protein DHS20C15_09400 [Planctomycetota bacterium]|nr:MAG: hypothetical protein DHS20C15_09400 [Planctomycetota bacterium]
MTHATEHHPTAFVRALARRLADDTRVDALWIEAETNAIQWPPFDPIDIHLGVPEPFLEALRAEFLQIVPELDAGARDLSQQAAPFKGFAGSGVLGDGTPFTYRLERTSQMAKVPRRGVNVLLDRSGGLLIPALSFE